MRIRIKLGNLVLLLALVLVFGLMAGCTRTVTVTYKYRSVVGWYFICTGPRIAPCIKGQIWHVSKARYDQARVGQPYTIHIG